MEEDDTLITTPYPMFLLQLSLRKIQNPTVIQKDNSSQLCAGAEEVLPFHHQLSEKGTLTTSNSHLRKTDFTSDPKLPLLQERCTMLEGTQLVSVHRNSEAILKQLEEYRLFWGRTNVYNNITPTSKNPILPILSGPMEA